VRRRFGRLDDDAMLKRLPRGSPRDILRSAGSATSPSRWPCHDAGRNLSPRLAANLERDFARLLPLVRWLNRALGYASISSRI